jgi:tetratricopeptide (TPR) repeat protein
VKRAAILLAFVGALVLALGGRAPAQTRGHEAALEAYASGQYERASELWLAELRESGAGALDRAALLYDLGNAAQRSKKPLVAAGRYAAALRIAPRHEDAWHNLELVRRQAGLEPADRGDLTATARRLLTVMTLSEAELLLLALAGALAAALAWEALRGGLAAKATSWALAGLLALATMPWAWQWTHAGDRLAFTVQPEGAPVTSEPRADSTLVGRIAPASEVECLDTLRGWVRVRDAAGSVGWIPSGAAVPLFEPFEFE